MTSPVKGIFFLEQINSESLFWWFLRIFYRIYRICFLFENYSIIVMKKTFWIGVRIMKAYFWSFSVLSYIHEEILFCLHLHKNDSPDFPSAGFITSCDIVPVSGIPNSSQPSLQNLIWAMKLENETLDINHSIVIFLWKLQGAFRGLLRGKQRKRDVILIKSLNCSHT